MLSLRPSILPWKAHLAMLTVTLIWFLFGMRSYVVLLQNRFCNAHTDMVSLWCGFLCDSFGSKTFSIILALKRFLFGMRSYI